MRRMGLMLQKKAVDPTINLPFGDGKHTVYKIVILGMVYGIGFTTVR